MIRERISAEEFSDEQQEVPMQTLVKKDHVIAIFTDDPTNDFYLMKVTQPLSLSSRPTTDRRGAKIPQNTEFFIGLYYDKVSQHSQTYRLIEKQPCVVPAASLLLICYEIEAKSTIEFNEDLNMYIMDLANMCKL